MAICNNKKCSTGECEQWKDCAGYVPIITNADRIRAMSDEELAAQFVQIVKEAIKAIADADLPNNLCDQMWSQFIDKLKQPAEKSYKKL